MQDLSGQTLKGYELREHIGAGGFGAIYRAYQPIVDREVAIKVILPEHANQPEFIRNFEAEAQFVARLEHPHIVPLFDYWREPDGAFLVMRFLRGGSLRDRLKSGPMELEEILHVLDQITSALALAHRREVVHRDIKPDNILLDEDNNAYLTDFGIAKAIGRGATDDNISGSLQYMSPEQLSNAPASPAVDIYSLGIVLFEMLTRSHPFGEASITDLIQKHLTEPLPDLPEDLPHSLNAIIQKATAKDPSRRYDEVREMTAAFRQVIAPSETAIGIFAWEELVNPYKGLRAFQTADAQDFFGRETLVERLVNRLADDHELCRFLAVVGPSGSGKSSVVLAGLVPVLWAGAVRGSANWFIVDMTPGAHPLRQLEAALLSVATRPPAHLYEMLAANRDGLLWASDRVLGDIDGDLLLIVDQFEELFTLVDDEGECAHFLDLLHAAVTAAGSRLRVVITLRADFTDRPLEYVEFGELLRHRTEFVLPLSAEEIERAITGPAHRVGMQVDTDLVAAVVSDVRDEPGALPLLQYTLTEVFERRAGRHLTLAAYQQSGGVLGALARRAEELFQTLNEQQQEVARQIFLRMVTLGEGTEDTRRRAGRSELASVVPDPGLLQLVLDAFGQFRLLAFDSELGTREPTVEVAHEALIREWDRLRRWLDDSRTDVRQERVLAAAAAEWLQAYKDAGYLLREARLVQFEEWARETDLALTELEREFIEASVVLRRKEKEAERLRQAHELELERRARNRMRVLVIVLAVGIVGAVVLSVFAFNQSRVAQNERDNALAAQGTAAANAVIAENNAHTAQARGTEVAEQVETAQAAQGTAEYEYYNAATQESIAQANATQANEYALTSEANAIVAQNNQAIAEERGTEVAIQVTQAWNAQQTAIFEADNAATQESIAQANATQANEYALTSEANAISAQNNEGTAQARGTEVAIQVTQAWNAQQTAIFEADNAATQERIAQENALTSEANAIIAQNNEATAQARGTEVAQQVLTSDANFALARDNAETADANANRASTQEAIAVNALATSEASERQARAQALASSAEQSLAVGNTDLALALALESADTNPDLIQAQSVLNSVVNVSPVLIAPDSDKAIFSPDGHYVVMVNNAEYALYMWDVDTRELIHRMQGHTDVIGAVEISPDGRYLISGSNDLSLVVWDAATGQELHRLVGHDTPITDIAIHPIDPVIVSCSIWDTYRWGEAATPNPDNSIFPSMIMWNIETGELIRRFPKLARPQQRARFSADGRTLFAWGTGYGGDMSQWNTFNGELQFTSDKNYNGFNRDGRIAWTGGQLPSGGTGYREGTVILWNAVAETEVRRVVNGFDWTRDQVRFVDFSPDGRTLLIGVDRFEFDERNDPYFFEKRLVYFNIGDGTVLNRYENNDIVMVTNAVFLADSITVLSTTHDNRLVLWDAPSGEIIREVGASDQPLTYLGLSPDERFASTHSADGSVRVWDISERETAEVQRIDVAGNTIVDIGFSPDATRVYVAVDTDVAVFDTSTGERLSRTYTGNRINAAAFSSTQPQALISVQIHKPSGSTVSGWTDEDGQVLRWNIDTGEVFRTYGDEEARLCSVAYSPDGRYALLEGQLWDIASGVRSQVFDPDVIDEVRLGIANDPALSANWRCQGQDSNTNYIDFIGQATSPDNRHAAVSLDYSIGWQIRQEGAPGSGVTYILLDEQYRQGSDLYLMSVETGEQTHQLTGFIGLPGRLTFSPDSRTLLVAIGEPDNALILYDVETGAVLRRFIGHTAAVNDVVFSPDGLTALSASDNGSLILWDVSTGQPIRRYSGHTDGVRRVAISYDGRLAVSTDGAEIILWRIETLQDLVAWTHENRAVPELSCPQRAQYNVRPLCAEMTPTPAPQTMDTPAPTTTAFLRAEVVVSAANVREAPNANAVVLTSLPRGTVVPIVAVNEGWFKVLLPDGREGWVARELVTRQ